MWPRTPMDSLSPAGSRPPDRQARRAAPRRRPSACRLSIEPLDPRIVPASLAVSDATIIEGNAGTQYAAVAVSLDAPSNRTVTVNYGTANGTAAAGSDYQAASGKLTFAPGQTSKTILVPVIGDRVGEGRRDLLRQAQRRQEREDRRRLGDRHHPGRRAPASSSSTTSGPRKGTAGTTTFTFTVSLSAACDQAVTVDFATRTARPVRARTTGHLRQADVRPRRDDQDHHGRGPRGQHARAGRVFCVLLSNASTNVWISGYGYGGILDDDAIPHRPG